ncbi:MAG: hypothetical protein QG614_160 [Patescibacteria group bacterium]|nr:hypothetical protein [Bacillota bacterium]MDQ5957185.1 hypothetical protein [Patescibacteria group bacterium]
MPPLRQNNNLNFGAKISTPDIDTGNPFRVLGVIFLIISIIFSVTSYVLLTYIKNKNTGIENNIRAIEAEITTMPLDEMLTFYNKTLILNNLLDKHYYITTQLNTLSSAVVNNVYFKDMSFLSKSNETGEVTVLASAIDEMDIVRQIDLLKDQKYSKFIKSVDLVSMKKDTKGTIEFTIKININPKIKPDYIMLDTLSNNRDITSYPDDNINSNQATTTNSNNNLNNSQSNTNNISSSTTSVNNPPQVQTFFTSTESPTTSNQTQN